MFVIFIFVFFDEILFKGKIKIDSVQQNVKSLNFFVQSLWLKNLPVVQETGRWTENLPGAILKSAAKYIYSRISLFLDYGRVVDEERRVALIRANSQATNFVALIEVFTHSHIHMYAIISH